MSENSLPPQEQHSTEERLGRLVSAAELPGEHYALPEAPASVGALLGLRHEVQTYTSYDDVARALVGIPMIPADMIRNGRVSGGDTYSTARNQTVPMDRVVGVGAFETWAGRGFAGGKKIQLKNGQSSLGAITAIATKYAREGQPMADEPHAPLLTLFVDADNQPWLWVETDGSHRVAAAKVHGDVVLTHVSLKTSEDPYKVNFSVAQELAAQEQQGRVGTIIPDERYIHRYVKQSEQADRLRQSDNAY